VAAGAGGPDRVADRVVGGRGARHKDTIGVQVLGLDQVSGEVVEVLHRSDQRGSVDGRQPAGGVVGVARSLSQRVGLFDELPGDQ
jgi:hypothetical protein